MRSFVDIEGSGKRITVIRGSLAGLGGLVRGVDDAALRHLKVENIGTRGINNVVAIDTGATNLRMINVVAMASSLSRGSSAGTFAVRVRGTATLEDVTATASGSGGLAAGLLVSQRAQLLNVTAQGSGGANNEGIRVETSGTELTARNSVFVGSPALRLATASATANLIATQLDGNRGGPGTFKCVDAYDQDFVELSASC